MRNVQIVQIVQMDLCSPPSSSEHGSFESVPRVGVEDLEEPHKLSRSGERGLQRRRKPKGVDCRARGSQGSASVVRGRRTLMQ